MRHHQRTKIEILYARHMGMREMVEAMFAEGFATALVRSMIRAQYGERLSLQTLDRYKRSYRSADLFCRSAALEEEPQTLRNRSALQACLR